MHYYVVGVNATGKSTILKQVSALTGIPYVHGTSELMSRLGIVDDYAALRALDQTYVLVEWGKTAVALLEQYGSKPFLLDTHIMNLTDGTIIPRNGPWIEMYDALVLITSPVEQIYERIIRDDTRDRAMFGNELDATSKLALLRDYQLQTQRLCRRITDDTSMQSIVIENLSGQIQSAVDQLQRAVIFD